MSCSLLLCLLLSSFFRRHQSVPSSLPDSRLNGLFPLGWNMRDVQQSIQSLDAQPLLFKGNDVDVSVLLSEVKRKFIEETGKTS